MRRCPHIEVQHSGGLMAGIARRSEMLLFLFTIVGVAAIVAALASVLPRMQYGNGEGPMTPEQLRVKLNLMTRDRRQAFLRACNLDPDLNDDQIVWRFQQPGGWNQRMRDALGERSDDENTGATDAEAAGFGRRGYYMAAIGIVIAVVAIIVALVK
jgi:hypothetical protein